MSLQGWGSGEPLSFGQRLHHLDAAFEYALYFYKRAVTAFQSLPVCYGGYFGFSVLFVYADSFLLPAIPSTVRTPPLMHRSASHKTELLSPVWGEPVLPGFVG